MKNFTFSLLLVIVCSKSFSQVSGTVFRDFNANGVKNNSASFNETFVSGITVNAYNSAGTLIATTTTTGAASPNFSFPASGLNSIASGTAVRLEFVGLTAGDHPSFNGTGNATNIQFVTAPFTTANFAINAPDDYWNNTTLADPALMAVHLRRGSTNSVYKGDFSVVHINNSSSGPYNPANNNVVTIDTTKRPATHAQTGAIFGLAVQRKQERFFASALLRRSVGLGTRGAGGIYVMDKSGSTWNLGGSFTLQGVTPSNGGASLDFGTVTRVSSPTSNDNYLSDLSTWTSGGGSDGRDIDAFGKASTMSYGDIEADPTSSKIYMVNLFQKRLIVFDATATTATLNGASAATLTPFTKAYTITSLPGCPAATGTGNNIRPFAVKIYKGKGYIGVISDAMSTQAKADLRGYVLQFDTANIAAGFTTVLTINFNNYNGTYFNPWVTTWAQAGGNGTSATPREYPQPIISAIEFNEDGSMDIGVRDRWGDQGGTFEFNPVSGATGHVQCSINGDLLHACWTGSTWILEGTAGSCDQPVANTNGSSGSNSFGTGYNFLSTGKEWFSDRSGDGGSENNVGGLTKLMGSSQIVSTVYDPMGAGETQGTSYWSNMGVQWNNVTTGVKTQIARVTGGNDNSLDKSNGMGDLEFLAQEQPIQVGNRIWLDANNNGIQDAGETTAAVPTGTTVTLRSPGPDGIYGNGDDQTWTTTTDANGNFFFSALSSPDNRKPANWTGVGNVILPGYEYRIEVVIPVGKSVTGTNTGGNDNIDNDATTSGLNAVLVFNTLATNHSYDIGIQNSLLPVKRLDVSANLKGSTATIIWVTENEINTAKFIVERSTDNRNFTAVGERTAAGTYVGTSTYNMNDDVAALLSYSVIYYRIKQLDADGRFAYSKVVAVRISAVGIVKTWPDPFADKLMITLNSNVNSKVQVKLTDEVGKLIINSSYAVTKGNNQITVNNLAGLSSGMYLFRIDDDSGNLHYVQKVIKQ